MFVLVETYEDINGREVGSVYGPFDSLEEAQRAKFDLAFPYPENVFIRTLYKGN